MKLKTYQKQDPFPNPFRSGYDSSRNGICGTRTEDQPNISRGALPVARTHWHGAISSESEIQIYPRLRPAWSCGKRRRQRALIFHSSAQQKQDLKMSFPCTVCMSKPMFAFSPCRSPTRPVRWNEESMLAPNYFGKEGYRQLSLKRRKQNH